MKAKNQTKNREILTGSRAIIVGFCETQVTAFCAAASEFLFEQADKAKADNDQKSYFEARQFIEQNSNKLQKHLELFVKNSFKENFTGNSESASRQLSAQKTAVTEDELSLVDDKEMEITVAINSIAHRVESECADELFGIHQRMAMLNRGVKLNTETAPYSPLALSQSFNEFISREPQEHTVKLLFLKLFDRYFARNLVELYKEINRYLISANVLPNLKFQSEKMVAPRRRKSDQFTADSEARQAELYESIAQAINSNHTPIDPSLPALTVDQAIQQINALQMQQASAGNLFSQPFSQPLPNTNVASFQQAIECVALLFDYVNKEETLGTPVKNLLSHLRTPYSKIALADPSFLANPDHDARQLFNAMINATEQWTDTDTESTSELVQRIKSMVERIISEASDDGNAELSVFSELLNEFTTYVEAFERKIHLTEKRNAQAAEGREKLKKNQQKVDQLIQQKINEESLPKAVEELVSDVWSSYLTYILLRHGEEGDAWKDAVNVVDSVLWYIEPKTSKKEQQMAIDIRPKLHASLESGMQSVGLDAAEIKSKINALELCRKLATENAASIGATKPESDSGKAVFEAKEPTSVAKKTTQPKTTEEATEKSAAETAPGDTEPAAQTTRPVKTRIQQQKEATEKQASKEKQPVVSLDDNRNKRDTKASKSRIKAAGTPPQREILERLQHSLDGQAAPAPGASRKQAPADAIDKVLSMKFGTWLDWNKPNEKPLKVKLTWYNTRTQNCMLSNSKGKEVAVVSANTIALGMREGWISITEPARKKPLFERMLETVSGQQRNTSSQPKYNTKR